MKKKDESGGQSGTGQKTPSANNEATLHPWFGVDNKKNWEKLKWHDHKVKRGLGSYLVLAKMIFGFYDRSPTWEYPDYINRMITSIVAIELLAFFYLTMTEVVKPLMCEIGTFACEPLVNFSVSSLVAILIAAALLFLFATYQLMRLSIAWQKLMVGNHRVFSFFVRFIPVRLSYFKQMFPDRTPYYLGTAWNFTDLDEKKS